MLDYTMLCYAQLDELGATGAAQLDAARSERDAELRHVEGRVRQAMPQ